MGRAAFPGAFLAFASVVLFVFVTVSTPVFNKVFFFKINVPDTTISGINVTQGGEVKYGMLGWCRDNDCSDRDLGYQLEGPISSLGFDFSLNNKTLENITYALVLNPVAGALALITSIFGLFAIRGGRITAIFLTLWQAFSALVAIVAFAVDIALWKVFQRELNKHIDDRVTVTSELGNANWLAVAGAGCLILGIFVSTLGICFGRSRRRDISYV